MSLLTKKFDFNIFGISLLFFLVCLINFLCLLLEIESVKDGKKVIGVGVDAVIVQGREAGGHVNRLGVFLYSFFFNFSYLFRSELS